MTSNASNPLAWSQIFWPRPLTEELAARVIKGWATDQRSPVVILEARSTEGAVSYLLGAPVSDVTVVKEILLGLCPGAVLVKVVRESLAPELAGQIKISTRHRAVQTDDIPGQARGILNALARARKGETLCLQVVLGPRRMPLAVPNTSPSSMVQPWYEVAWHGNGGQLDGEKRSALRTKVSEPGFACTIRLGANAKTDRRTEMLLLGLMSALRGGEAPGVRLRLSREPGRRLKAAAQPWIWPLRLGVHEILALSGWPVSTSRTDDELPGLPSPHPRILAPAQLAKDDDRLIARTNAPGIAGQLGYSVTDALRHTWVLGPTGTGKSTLLLNLIVSDMEAGRPVVVVEPNDLITDLLERIPANRRDDVVLLDCTDSSPVGINPLARHGRNPELVADGFLATFQALYGDGSSSALGPRSTDILANCLNVLARHGQDGDASLVMLPLLLTNAGFRRSLTQHVIKADPIAAAPFWAWFESLSVEARSQIIAPLSNKLRPLLRPHLRGVLGQRRPKFNIRDVVLGDSAKPKILLVPLQKGVVGPETAELLGALVISDLWLALRERRSQPERQRVPLMIYVDEVQDYLRLPTDLADALATSRSLKAGWHLAHQYISQLDPRMRAAFEANARSRIAFQLGTADARAFAAGQNLLAPEDFSSLAAFHIYASLMHGNAVQPWASGVTAAPPKRTSSASDLRARSRRQYGQSLDQIEADFAGLVEQLPTTQPDAGTTGRRRRAT